MQSQAFDFDELPGDCKRIIVQYINDYKYGLRYRLCLREMKNTVFQAGKYGETFTEYIRYERAYARAYDPIAEDAARAAGEEYQVWYP